MPSIKTENLYLGAYLLADGARLSRVRLLRTAGRPTAAFELEGSRVEQAVEAYRDGTAMVNLADYLKHLESLKDELFDALRRCHRERRREHAEYGAAMHR